MISFQSIAEEYVTFLAEESAQEGTVCKITADASVGACASGDAFCGVCGAIRGGHAGVKLHGYARLPYSGAAPQLGYTLLAADGTGGVKASESGERSCLVVEVDSEGKTVGLFL